MKSIHFAVVHGKNIGVVACQPDGQWTIRLGPDATSKDEVEELNTSLARAFFPDDETATERLVKETLGRFNADRYRDSLDQDRELELPGPAAPTELS